MKLKSDLFAIHAPIMFLTQFVFLPFVLAIFFSPKLIHAIAEATAKEVRAKYNNYTKTGQYGDHKGISCFSPVINIMRHPLWGRNQVRQENNSVSLTITISNKCNR